MVKDCVLLFRKVNEDVVKSSYADFGFAVIECNWPKIEVKKPHSRDWPGEDGLDVYIPSTMRVASTELTVKFGYKGGVGTAKDAERLFSDFLLGRDGSGARFNLYDVFNHKGCANVYTKQVGESTLNRSNIDEGLEVEITFVLINPSEEIVLTHVAD